MTDPTTRMTTTRMTTTRMATHSGHGLAEFNELPESEARALLVTCLAVPRWVDELIAGRPYGDLDQLYQIAEARARTLTESEVEVALARHPRIGERAGAEHDAAFSHAEQAHVERSDEAVTTALRTGNVQYEERFGRVFLIRAAGRSSEEILRELERRLTNDSADELAEVTRQLAEIAMLRLRQLVASGTEEATQR